MRRPPYAFKSSRFQPSLSPSQTQKVYFGPPSRGWCNGSTRAFQACSRGSNPLPRSRLCVPEVADAERFYLARAGTVPRLSRRSRRRARRAPGCPLRYGESSMEAHFKPETQAKIARAAAEHNSDPDAYVQQLVETYLDHDEWFRPCAGRLGPARPGPVPHPRGGGSAHRQDVPLLDGTPLVTESRR